MKKLSVETKIGVLNRNWIKIDEIIPRIIDFENQDEFDQFIKRERLRVATMAIAGVQIDFEFMGDTWKTIDKRGKAVSLKLYELLEEQEKKYPRGSEKSHTHILQGSDELGGYQCVKCGNFFMGIEGPCEFQRIKSELNLGGK
ncbi:MAG: hypothetical protein M0R80_27655 [Proteobacteria bacterium]|jgi:hypothetical protein|nr:hypothetical protein [Pseudomonadota bacterium]